MPQYSISFVRSARRELEQLPPHIAERILVRVEALAEDPRPRGCVKLQGPSDLWRIRVGDYRVVYAVNDTDRHIDVDLVRHRSEAYR